VLVEHLALRLYFSKTDIDLTFDGTAPELNSEGIDYSLSYLRKKVIANYLPVEVH
jgi:hypothetical protein